VKVFLPPLLPTAGTQPLQCQTILLKWQVSPPREGILNLIKTKINSGSSCLEVTGIFLSFMYCVLISGKVSFSPLPDSRISHRDISCLHVSTVYVELGILSSCLIVTCITGVFLASMFQLFLCCSVYSLSCLIVT
jgi:hypothetical protein